MKLKVSLKSECKGIPGRKGYTTTINASNYKEISLVLKDLKFQGLPIEKAIKEFKLSNSDWEIALGL